MSSFYSVWKHCLPFPASALGTRIPVWNFQGGAPPPATGILLCSLGCSTNPAWGCVWEEGPGFQHGADILALTVLKGNTNMSVNAAI